jgi:virginiamycin B lyase
MRKALCSSVTALLVSAAAMVGAQAPAQGGRGGAQVTLPEGAGKELVQTTCSKCHGLNLVTNSGGYNQRDWGQLIDSMLTLPGGERDTITSYLEKSFPDKGRPGPVIVEGKARVEIKEWVVPSLGSRPHDPLAAHDGTLWWTGQWANVLGRLDMKTGAMKEFPLKLKTAGSGPHGLTEDKDGNIWYTGNSKALVGKLNPKTGEVTEYPMPDPAARDPHTPLFDSKGMLWFTVQQANMVGRLNPANGDIKLVTMPTPRSLPYGMVFDSKGVPFIVLFGTNKVASLDPETMVVKEYPLPNAASRPRRIAITGDDIIWYADYSRGYLGRLDPKSGAVKEWLSPSGEKSQPYGIATYKGIVWYNESAVRPNTLVRFDPATEKFQTWIIPSGGGVIRNMMATRDGDLVIACSGVNRVGFVDVK